MRHLLIIGNWKLNGSKDIVGKIIEEMRKELNAIQDCSVVIAPPVIYLDQASHLLSDSLITLGAQNVDINLFGAFTGEISARMLKDIGVRYVIIGHSECRIYHKESDKLIAKKFAILKSENLIPVLCIGETKEENEAGKTKEVCVRQIDAVLETQGIEAFNNAVIAYEPVWAIGTGKSATPVQAQKVHKFIRNYLAKKDVKVAENMIIQYGGSVNDKNAAEFLTQPDIDGVLIGSASLKVNVFSAIVRTAITTKSTIRT